MLSSSGNPGPDQRQVVYVLQYPSSHTGFPQEGSVSTHVQRKEFRKFHGELQKELKQVVGFGQPAFLRIPIDETREIVSGRTYW